MNERMAPQLLEQKSISAWYWPSVVLILTGLLVILIDAPLSEAIGKLAEPNTWQRRIIKQSYRVFTKYTFIGVAVVLLFKRQRKNLLIGYGTALGLGTAMIHLLKFVVGRARPQAELGAYQFQPFTFADKFDAFPSGHVGGAMMLALLVGTYYPRLRVALLILAVLVAVGRIIQDRHFVSDTLVGAGIATLAVSYCYHRLGPAYYPVLRPRAGSDASDGESESPSDPNMASGS
jgi:membrane-associated phospholipid phosphatase